MNDQLSPYAQKPWLRHYDYWVPAETTIPEQSIYQVLAAANVHYGHHRATAFLGGHLTFAEIKQQADKLATSLLKLGVKPGDCVGIMLPNCPQYVISFFAIVRLGAIAVNINPTYTAREVGLVANDSGLRVLITLNALAPIALGVKAETKIETIIATDALAFAAQRPKVLAMTEGTLSFSEMIEGVAEPQLPPLNLNAGDEVAALVYTGGTTGVPKGAMITHRNMWASTVMCRVWNREFTRAGEESFLLVIPYFHIYGLIVGLVYSTYVGAVQIQIPKYDANMLLAAINEYEPTYFPAVPTLFISLLNHPDAPSSKLGKIRRLNSGSAPLPVEVMERFEAMSGASVYEGWGMTETTAIGSGTPTFARRKLASIGFPFPNTEMKIVDLESGTRELPVGEEGELCIRGPQIMKGYWNKPEATAEVLKDGWLYTGDVARMDEDGTFYIVQRKKDMLLVSGFNVYPNEIEDVLFTHPAIKECAVIGVPDEYRGEAVKAFVVCKENATTTKEDIIEFCKDQLAKYKLPTHIEFLTALPKSAVGKVLRRELREKESEK
ncbi:MAG: long-chain fatty acid--CoA ligase [Acidobacteria bacterium]|nr:long-chain fatty acid--CoA ligase [Acidobacteriota bacterium]